MTLKIDEAEARAAAAYNAAADRYDDAANSFWARFGRSTVSRLNLPKGATVLDVCCGTGASALPAAEAVGPGGRVIGVDLAQQMLENARRKAQRPGLVRGFNPWDRICDPASLRALFMDAGIEQVDIAAESKMHPIPSPDAWWSAVMRLRLSRHDRATRSDGHGTGA